MVQYLNTENGKVIDEWSYNMLPSIRKAVYTKQVIESSDTYELLDEEEYEEDDWWDEDE